MSQLNRDQIFKKAYGTLLGVAAGDAIGMPSSMMSRKAIIETFPEKITTFLPAPEGHCIHGGMKAGEITDDTQQTLLLADMYIEDGKFTKEATAKKLLEWAKNLDAFSGTLLGPSSMKALMKIDSGTPIEEAGTMGDTNGAAMRISPTGIVNPGNFDATIKDVVEVSTATHFTDIAISGASAVACAVSAGMVNASLDSLIKAFNYGATEGLKFGNPYIGASVAHRAKWALSFIHSGKEEEEIWSDLYNYIGATVVMAEAVPTALAMVAFYEGDPLKTVIGCANMGGDCDTVGAIAGAMAGAFAGSDAFPQSVIDILCEVNKVDFKKYAEDLTEKIMAKQ